MDILPVPRYLFICAFPCDLSVAVIKMTLFKVTSAKRVDPGNWAQRSSSRRGLFVAQIAVYCSAPKRTIYLDGPSLVLL